MKRKKTVLAFGTFDLLHEGHLWYLKKAKKLGNKLVVVIAKDETVKKIKGFKPIKNEKSRLTMIKAIKHVDDAVLGLDYFKGRTEIIKKIKPDVIAFGYDLKNKQALKKELQRKGIRAKIVFIKAFKAHKFKSSKIRKRIHELHKRMKRKNSSQAR